MRLISKEFLEAKLNWNSYLNHALAFCLEGTPLSTKSQISEPT